MAKGEKPKVIVIAGPTAVGKTSFAVEVASVLSGEIVNADSMQVYRGMDVGTAKPGPDEKKGIPHYLMDLVEPDEEFNAAIYRSHALPIVRDISSRGKSCLVVGGTGLYIRTLLGGLFKSPPADLELRHSLQRECERVGSEILYRRLKALDPVGAIRIHPHDKVRIIRALEILHLTHARPSVLLEEHGFRDRSLGALTFCLSMDRAPLYDRINARSTQMIENGLVQETENLLMKGYGPDLKPMKAIGYRHMVRYLQGEWSLDEAIKQLKRDTRRYAKRQLTWFKADPKAIWITPDDVHLALDKIRGFLSETP